MSFDERSLELHKTKHGKIEVVSKVPLDTREDLSLAYTPGVAAVSRAIAEDTARVYDYTAKGNLVAIVTDGSAVLGLGNIGPEAALPVMEGKAVLFKEFAGIDAVPVCLATQEVDAIVETVKRIAPTFGGINLEDISAPRCFEVEAQLQDIGIPVFHDDQHGTAIVVLAGLLNASRVVGKKMEDLQIVVNGAGAAGVAITKLLSCLDTENSICVPVRDVVVCDSQGIIHKDRTDLNSVKQMLVKHTNTTDKKGTLADALHGADVFIGVSVPGVLSQEMIRTMAGHPIVFALSNPTPEIDPREAHEAGAAVIATGRSDYSNQVNNALAFPGIFRGALDIRAPRITAAMKRAAAHALASCITSPTHEEILPRLTDRTVAPRVAEGVREAGKDAE